MGLDEERALIVNMVAEKKISPAEAAELIAALEQTAAAERAEALASEAPTATEGATQAQAADAPPEVVNPEIVEEHPWQTADESGGWKAGETIREAREWARDVGREARDRAREAKDRARDAGREARDRAREAAREAREGAWEAASAARDAAHGAADFAREKAREAGGLGHDIGRLGSTLAGLVDRIVGKVGSAVEDLDFQPVWMSGTRVEFSEALEGTFTAERPVIELENANGSVELHAHDGTQARLELHCKARGQNEAEGRELFHRAVRLEVDEKGVRVVHQPDGFRLMQDLVVNMVLHLPQALCYNVQVKTHNGRVLLEGLQVVNARAETGNGRIEVTGVSGDRLELHTGNGRCTVAGSLLRMQVHTGNGRVALMPTGQGPLEWTAHTGNGAIDLNVSALPGETGIDLEARTGMGHVELSAAGFTETERTGHGNRRVRATRPGTDGQLRAELSTGMGSVAIQ